MEVPRGDLQTPSSGISNHHTPSLSLRPHVLSQALLHHRGLVPVESCGRGRARALARPLSAAAAVIRHSVSLVPMAAAQSRGAFSILE